MKRLLSLLIAIVLLFIITACNTLSSETVNNDPEVNVEIMGVGPVSWVYSPPRYVPFMFPDDSILLNVRVTPIVFEEGKYLRILLSVGAKDDITLHFGDTTLVWQDTDLTKPTKPNNQERDARNIYNYEDQMKNFPPPVCSSVTIRSYDIAVVNFAREVEKEVTGNRGYSSDYIDDRIYGNSPIGISGIDKMFNKYLRFYVRSYSTTPPNFNPKYTGY